MTLTSGPAWFIDHINGDRDTGGCTTPAAVAGYPHITVPAGLYRGLPIGLSFFSTAWTRAHAYQAGLRLGAADERAPQTGLRRQCPRLTTEIIAEHAVNPAAKIA